MRQKGIALRLVLLAAVFTLCGAVSAFGQNRPPVKQNQRVSTNGPTQPSTDGQPAAVSTASYSYEFAQPVFYINHIVVEHDSLGHGHVTFEKQNAGDPIVEPLELSQAALKRILGLWDALNFLGTDTNYQSEHQFPHLGTMWLQMKQGGRERKAEFNWTNDKNVSALVDEYRHAADQAIFIFDMTVARQNQPLESPKLMDYLDRMIARNELSDPQQLIPLLEDLSTDERVPLITRNHATRILKKLKK
jgi:hypothetical protein